MALTNSSNNNVGANVGSVNATRSLYGIASGFAGSQVVEGQAAVQTTDATETNVFTITVAEEEAVFIECWILGFKSTFDETVRGKIEYSAMRDTSANITETGGPYINQLPTVDGSVTADVDTGTQTLRIRVKGASSETWNWVCTYKYHKVLTNS